MSILIEKLSKKFENLTILKNINFEIKTGCLLALLGPSGSGKTTLLRIIAGLEFPDEGKVWIDGKNTTSFSIQKRDIGFVFQNYSLFPKMTVFENISFGLDIKNFNARTISDRVTQLLQLIQLEKFSKRYPYQLSGGQKQRVALARALASNPKILLLDEPFGALDNKLRKELKFWLHLLHEEVSVTTVFVTHDKKEAFDIADDIVILQKGGIEQFGTPKEIFDYPVNNFIKSYLEKRV